MAFRIDGYSERGIVNALCEDIVRENDVQKLEEFLGWIKFPFQQGGPPDFSGIKKAQILVEQSFSDFGDLDLLILLDHDGDRKQAVLIEAKVATENPVRIEAQWDDFLSFLGGDGRHSSSLFVQIYRKLRLVQRVSDLNNQFDPHPIWGRQSLGANRIVLKAAKLLAEYRANPWYVVLVPDNRQHVSHFFDSTLSKYRCAPCELPSWDTSRMGYLTWPDFHERIDNKSNQQKWRRSLSAFDWNEHQIHFQPQPDVEDIVVNSVGMWNGQRVVVVGPSTRSHRVVFAESSDGRFPRSFTIDTNDFSSLMGEKITIGHPEVGKTYSWNPVSNEPIQPPDRAPVPMPPQLVKIIEFSWKTTRVILVDQNGKEHGGEFHVFPHHLERKLTTTFSPPRPFPSAPDNSSRPNPRPIQVDQDLEK